MFVGSNPGSSGEKNDNIKNDDYVVRKGECAQVSVENGGLIKKALQV